jgi:hypothetical protein
MGLKTYRQSFFYALFYTQTREQIKMGGVKMKKIIRKIEKEFKRQGFPLSEYDLSGCLLSESDILELVVAGHSIQKVVAAAIENLGWNESKDL